MKWEVQHQYAFWIGLAMAAKAHREGHYRLYAILQKCKHSLEEGFHMFICRILPYSYLVLLTICKKCSLAICTKIYLTIQQTQLTPYAHQATPRLGRWCVSHTRRDKVGARGPSGASAPIPMVAGNDESEPAVGRQPWSYPPPSKCHLKESIFGTVSKVWWTWGAWQSDNL